MRRTLLTTLLLTPLLLTGCIKDSASYFVNADSNEHTLTVRVEQAYFWDEELTLTLFVARMPDCQRRFELARVPLDEVVVELFATDANVFTLRAGAQVWQVETQTCTQLPTPAAGALGEAIGSYRLDDEDKMVFEKAGGAVVPTAVPAPQPIE